MGVRIIEIKNPKKFNGDFAYGDYRINFKSIGGTEFEYNFSIRFWKLYGEELEFEWKVFRSQSAKYLPMDGVQDGWHINGLRRGYSGDRITIEDFKEIDKVKSKILERIYKDSEVQRIMDEDYQIWKFPIHQI
jgi:hypothetical protein